jgi:ribose transport system permease protein
MTTETDVFADRRRTHARNDRILDVLGRFGVPLFLLLMIVVFTVWQPTRFATWSNATNILSDQAIPGILAIAVLLPLIVGDFDLSVGANLGFVSIFAAWGVSTGMPVVLVVVLAIVLGLAIGALNAIFVVGIGINAFVATLAMGTILAGGNLLITGGSVFYQGIPPEFTAIAQTRWLGLQATFFYFVIIAVVMWFVLERTPFGRRIRATGINRNAARLSGIKTRQMVVVALLVAAGLAAIAGVLQSARVGAANPSTGPEFLLPAYAAAFLGAAAFHRGFFNVWGTVVGVFVLAVGISGLNLAGAPFWLPDVFNGLALVGAVSLSMIVERRRGITR